MDYDIRYRELRAGADAKSVSDAVEDSLLGTATVPSGHVDFMCRWMADDELVNRSGMEYFVLALYTDRDKLAAEQLEFVLSCIQKNYVRVRQATLALALCDFVARAAAPSTATSMLGQMIDTATTDEALTGC